MPNATSTGIGATLRSGRETLGVSVEEAAWRTRIRPEYLRALEEERFDACGHLAHARAYLHSYARFLALDATAIVRDYAKRVEGEELSPIEHLNERDKGSRRTPKPNWLIAGFVAATLLIGLSLAGIVRGPGPRTASTGPGNALPSLPASTQPKAAVSAPAVAPAAAPITLVVVAHGRSWVRALADGTLVFEGTLTPGASKTITGTTAIDLTVGNAGMVRLILNGRDMGQPGKAGDVYRARLGPRGPIPAK